MPLTTRLCSALGIQIPIIQGPLGGPFELGAELIAAVSNAGGLGSIATTFRSPGQVVDDIRRVRELAGSRPFAVNVTRRPLDENVLAAILEERPPVLSLALGAPGDVAKRAHDAGSLFLQQVTTVAQAIEAASAGADVIVAQGAEAGGFSGAIGTMALIPQVVDAVASIPVVAAGGIADGRGLAAALMLGAEGVNLGTRFLASVEARVPENWKAAVVAAQSEDAVKVDFADQVFPPPTALGWPAVPRALRSPFIEKWLGRTHELAGSVDEVRSEIRRAMDEQRIHEYLPLAGHTAGAIKEILPAGEIVRRIVSEAEETLARRAAETRG